MRVYFFPLNTVDKSVFFYSTQINFTITTTVTIMKLIMPVCFTLIMAFSSSRGKSFLSSMRYGIPIEIFVQYFLIPNIKLVYTVCVRNLGEPRLIRLSYHHDTMKIYRITNQVPLSMKSTLKLEILGTPVKIITFNGQVETIDQSNISPVENENSKK